MTCILSADSDPWTLATICNPERGIDDGPLLRASSALSSGQLTVSYRPCPSNYIKTTYSYPKARHSRRAASMSVIGTWVCALVGRHGPLAGCHVAN
ncbi:hypothetical protein DPMN_140521 [Dreissena polymorpha]|uniref:Uncharacterized protein n=1 Tax=Dreissena polymorpha TaxID=45954 RepID=A0A9D4GAK6_DREPO|nr:hypothetical protein DPMN_140521 [Dreissena polymorpha]